MRTRSIVLVVAGVLVAVVAAGLGVGGGVLAWAHATQRDDAGFYTTSSHRYETPAFALTSTEIHLGSESGGRDWTPFDGSWATGRIQAEAAGGDVFVGVGRHVDVERYLAGVAHDELADVDFAPFRPTYRRSAGELAPAPPAEQQDLWVASASGPGRQTLTWDLEQGRWAVVVMNDDASPGVAVDASFAVKTPILVPIAVGLLVAAALVAAVGALLIVLGVRDRDAGDRWAPADRLPPALLPAGAYPARLDGHVTDGLSRWRWLVKWFLAIPHLVVLAFLWAAFVVLTVVAGGAVALTGRYPRPLFDFNVGVMRWTWRVTFYAFVLGTDRYPPFTLARDAGYPADLDVAYPERLSRGLVWVKWWLLALPHYLVVTLFGGGLTWWTWGAGGEGGTALGIGLVGLLVLVAAAVLTVTGRYPEPVFDFVMGMQRWSYRVLAYAALLRDEYPPFRLDTGGADPGSLPLAPPPVPDTGDALLEV